MNFLMSVLSINRRVQSSGMEYTTKIGESEPLYTAIFIYVRQDGVANQGFCVTRANSFPPLFNGSLVSVLYAIGTL
jgi:hypothetical protein